MYLHNPWVTYGIGLHRLREAGLALDLFDDMDEKEFDLDQIHQFCTQLFISDREARMGVHLPHPRKDWDAFVDSLKELLKREKLPWNPVKRKRTPWIDLIKLDALHGRSKHMSSAPRRRASMMGGHQRHSSFHTPRDPSEVKPPVRRQQSFAASRQPSFNRPAPPAAASGQVNPPQRPRRATVNDMQRPNMQETFRRNSAPSNINSARQSGVGSGRQVSAPASMASPSNLKGVLQHWSHQAPAYKTLQPLQKLLVDVPTLFPPQNKHVEAHEYYSKWKAFSEDAFDGVGDELNGLLKRAARKGELQLHYFVIVPMQIVLYTPEICRLSPAAKFFLHPDKLPKDLNGDQSLLFKTIWDVLQESERATINVT